MSPQHTVKAAIVGLPLVCTCLWALRDTLPWEATHVSGPPNFRGTTQAGTQQYKPLGIDLEKVVNEVAHARILTTRSPRTELEGAAPDRLAPQSGRTQG